MVRSFFAIFSSALLLLVSCGEGKVYLPKSTGMPGEVIVVIEDEYWNGMLGDTIKYELENILPCLPRAEYEFDLGQYNHEGFSKIIKSHRNVLLFEIKGGQEKPRVDYLKDVWAKDQLVIKVVARNRDEAIQLFTGDAQKIRESLNSVEYNRLIENFKALKHAGISEKLKKNHRLNLVVPKEYRFATDKNNFVWLKSDIVRYVSGEAHDVDQGIFVYYYPYVNDSTFTLEYLLQIRDSVCKANVPGSLEGSYMATERDSTVYPIAKEVSLNGKYAMEIRGLYKTIGDAYGGPFISLSTYDEARQRIVTIDCYVFAPKFNKREYIREMQAICYSLQFEGEGK